MSLYPPVLYHSQYEWRVAIHIARATTRNNDTDNHNDEPFIQNTFATFAAIFFPSSSLVCFPFCFFFTACSHIPGERLSTNLLISTKIRKSNEYQRKFPKIIFLEIFLSSADFFLYDLNFLHISKPFWCCSQKWA